LGWGRESAKGERWRVRSLRDEGEDGERKKSGEGRDRGGRGKKRGRERTRGWELELLVSRLGERLFLLKLL